MTAKIIPLPIVRRESRLLAAARDALRVLDEMSLDDLMEGKDALIRAELVAAIREAEEVDRLEELENMDELDFVMETVRQTRRDLPEHIPLIGFAGAPFTLASYAIEGGSSRNYTFTKTLMYRDESAWRTLMERLARSVARYLNAQIAAGAQAVPHECPTPHTKKPGDRVPGHLDAAKRYR